VSGEVAAAYPERVNKLILANIDYFDERDRIELSNTCYKAFKIKEDGSHLRVKMEFFLKLYRLDKIKASLLFG
jgi:hypothetical protein